MCMENRKTDRRLSQIPSLAIHPFLSVAVDAVRIQRWTGATDTNTSFTGDNSTFGSEVANQKPLIVVRLPSDIQTPLHAVETSSGHFITLHSLERVVGEITGSEEDERKVAEEDEKEKHQPLIVVSKLTRDGRLVVRRFIPQNQTQALNDPYYLALDSDDRVFVADTGRDRVILLDSDLRWIRILCSAEEEDKRTLAPHTLCHDKVDGQLIVAGFFRQGVNVYSIDRQ